LDIILPNKISRTEVYKNKDAADIHSRNPFLSELRKELAPLLADEKVIWTTIVGPLRLNFR
jgi:quinol monooxygenase YgiN